MSIFKFRGGINARITAKIQRLSGTFRIEVEAFTADLIRLCREREIKQNLAG